MQDLYSINGEAPRLRVAGVQLPGLAILRVDQADNELAVLTAGDDPPVSL